MAFNISAFSLPGNLRYRLDLLLFRRQRAAYYSYLSSVLLGLRGRETLIQIFIRDARRYGSETARGRLSAIWSRTYPVVGGDLSAMWADCFPQDEVDALRLAQLAGNQALIQTLRDLAHALALSVRARRLLISTLWPAVVSLLMLVLVLSAVPLFTVPQLRQVFEVLPTSHYGPLARNLFGLAGFLDSYLFVLFFLLLLISAVAVWSLPNMTGSVRQRLDHFWLWQFYRQVAALRFLAILLVILAPQELLSMQLRSALARQKYCGSPWLRWHIDTMLAHVDAGLIEASTFDTGLFDREAFWYFSDMSTAHGLVPALSMLREHMAENLLPGLARKAAMSRWVLLLIGVGCVLGLGIWHYGAIDELRRSLMMFYAN